MQLHNLRAVTVCAAVSAAIVLAGHGLLRAQTIGGGGGVTQAYVDNAISNLQTTLTAAMPTAYASVPQGPSGLGSASPTDKTYVPGSATQRQGVMRTTMNTDSSGNWSVTWANGFSFQSSTPTVVVEAGNPGGSNTITCNWRTRSSTGASGFCQQTNTALVALLGITITVAPTLPTAGTPISIVMAEPTQ